MTGADLADFDQTRTIYPPWHVKFLGKKFSKKFSRNFEKFENFYFCPLYKGKTTPPYFSAHRWLTIWLHMVFGDPQGVLKIFEIFFENFSKFRELRPKSAKNLLFWIAEKSKSDQKIRKFLFTMHFYIHGAFEKKKIWDGNFFRFRDIFYQNFAILRMSITWLKNGQKKFFSPNFFSKFIHLCDAPQWVT